MHHDLPHPFSGAVVAAGTYGASTVAHRLGGVFAAGDVADRAQITTALISLLAAVLTYALPPCFRWLAERQAAAKLRQELAEARAENERLRGRLAGGDIR